jgi:L-alanine-DL-glutamate epimerase-like enolase superfamily enzyme
MMKIRSIDPIVVGHYVLVQVTTEDGLTGLGEATVDGRELASVEAIKHIGGYLAGHDATRIEHIWQDVFRGQFWRGGPVLLSAISGIDIALWDLNAKALGVPIWRLLGGKAREKVLVYRHVYAPTPEELAERCCAAVEEGYRVVRISPTDPFGEPFEPGPAIRKSIGFFEAVRRAVGDEIEVVFEVHTRLSPHRAIELCNAIAEYRPLFVEDPIRSENPASFALLRQHTHVPIGTGEQLGPKWSFRELIERDLIDFLRVDLCHSGGITEGKKIAAMGEAHYQEMALHSALSPVCLMASLHLDVAVPNVGVQEYAPAQPRWEEVLSGLPVCRDGYLEVPEGPGLGLELDQAAAARYPYTPRELPHWRRADGSVQDW